MISLIVKKPYYQISQCTAKP